MSSPMYIEYRGLLLPHGAHSLESLEFAQHFSVEDSDVFSVTYPKSGKLIFYPIIFIFSMNSLPFFSIRGDTAVTYTVVPPDFGVRTYWTGSQKTQFHPFCRL